MSEGSTFYKAVIWACSVWTSSFTLEALSTNQPESLFSHITLTHTHNFSRWHLHRWDIKMVEFEFWENFKNFSSKIFFSETEIEYQGFPVYYTLAFQHDFSHSFWWEHFQMSYSYCFSIRSATETSTNSITWTAVKSRNTKVFPSQSLSESPEIKTFIFIKACFYLMYSATCINPQNHILIWLFFNWQKLWKHFLIVLVLHFKKSNPVFYKTSINEYFNVLPP